jgi:hypothetical protein
LTYTLRPFLQKSLSPALVFANGPKALSPRRLSFFGINAETITLGLRFKSVLAKEGPNIADRLFKKLLEYPETRSTLEDLDIKMLKLHQTCYWSLLFDCKFDSEYMRVAQGIGRGDLITYAPLNVHIASQTFFQAEAYCLCNVYFAGDQTVAACTAIMRIINMDLAITLAAQLRRSGSSAPT